MIQVTYVSISDGDPHGDCSLPALPLDHSHHHSPPPMSPQHVLYLLIGKSEYNTDDKPLKINIDKSFRKN